MPGVMGKAGARPDRQLEAVLEVEEGDGAIFELLADDAGGRQAKSIPVERDRALQVVDTERDQRNAWFHASLHGAPRG